MEDHLLNVNDLLNKYNVLKPAKRTKIVIQPAGENLGRKIPQNLIFPPKDHGLLSLIYEGICDPVKILSFLSVSFLLIVYLVNREEKKHFLLFIFTITIIIISTAIEIYGEIRINYFYKRRALNYNSRIIKDDQIHTVKNEYVDIKDIVVLRRGDIVPADSILIQSNNLKIDQSILSGNRELVAKTHTKRSEIFEHSGNVVLAGDKIISGRGLALVVKVGKDNKIGKIYEKTVKKKDLESLLYSEVKIFFVGSFIFAIVVSTTLILFGLITGIEFIVALDLMFAIALALIPECIPSTIKFLLFSAVSKLEKKGITIRDVGVIEKLGLITMVCADKNAFIPSENIFCSNIYDGKKLIDVELAFEDKDEDSLQYFASIEHITGLISRNKSGNLNKQYHRPLEILSEIFSKYFVSFTRMSLKVKDVSIQGLDGTIVDEIDFMSLYITGPVEHVLKMCDKIKIQGKIVRLTHSRMEKILDFVARESENFNSLIGLAFRSYGKKEKKVRRKGITFICIYCLEEMTEFDAPLVTNILKSAQIGFSIVTNVAEKSKLRSSKNVVGLCNEYSDDSSDPKILSNDKFYAADLRYRSKFLNSENFILFQSNREDKRRVVKDLKNLNQIVCYIGTDISDCRAMSEADIGICFENSGIICKEACSIVLKSDKIEDFLYCIEEGRLFFVNLRKAIKYIASHILPQFIPFVFYACVGTPIALSAILLIFLNYLVEMIPAIFFTYEEPEYNLLIERPINKDDIYSSPPAPDGDEGDSWITKIKYWYRSFVKIINRGLIYHMGTLGYPVLESGIISSIGCMLGFFAALSINKVPVSKMFFSANEYFHYGSQPFKLTNGELVDFEEQLGILFKCESTYFFGLIICQFANMIICRREKNYFFYRFFSNFKIIICSLVGTCVSVYITYSRFFQKFLLIGKPSLPALMFPLGSAALLLTIDTLKKFKIQQNLVR